MHKTQRTDSTAIKAHFLRFCGVMGACCCVAKQQQLCRLKALILLVTSITLCGLLVMVAKCDSQDYMI